MMNIPVRKYYLSTEGSIPPTDKTNSRDLFCSMMNGTPPCAPNAESKLFIHCSFTHYRRKGIIYLQLGVLEVTY